MDNDLRPVLGKGKCDASADATGRSRHKRSLSPQVKPILQHQKYPPLSMISEIVSPWRTHEKMSTSLRSMPSARSSTS